MMNPTFGRGRAAIVGAAESDLGEVGPGYSAMDLMAQGVHRALADAGLTTRDVDGISAPLRKAAFPAWLWRNT